MKRLICLLTVLMLLLPGCAFGRDRHKEPVTFYYLRNHDASDDYREFFSQGAVDSEAREASGHREDLKYLLAMYLQGPLRDDLKNPFPAGCLALSITQNDRTLHIRLNTLVLRLNEMELTVAGACLAKTFFELADVDQIHLDAAAPNGEILFFRDFTPDNLLLEDSWTQPTEATE